MGGEGRRRLKHVLVLFGVLLATVSCETPFSIPITHQLDGAMALGISFPPLKDERSRDQSAVHLPRLGVELIRFDVQWAFREPEQGVFDWEAMDRRVALAAGLGLNPFLTFPPDAPD